MDEKNVETKKCKQCGASFVITDKDMRFYDKISPIFAGKKCAIPTPTFCPDCRRQRRQVFRNERKLYKRKCDFSGKDIFSCYPQTATFPVYDRAIWQSDVWDALSYGVDFDFSQGFFDQFLVLKNKVPHYAKSTLNPQNCDYSNNFSNSKNCYLCFNGGDAEDCYYCTNFWDVKKCVDCCHIQKSESCYECIDCQTCNKLFFSQNCNNCFNSFFLSDCIGCDSCWGCKNLINKSYCIQNKQYTKEEYLEKTSQPMGHLDIEKYLQTYKDFFMSLPVKYLHTLQNEHCEGEYVYNSKNVALSMDIIDCEDLKYCSEIKNDGKDMMDVHSFGWTLRRCYESVVIGDGASNVLFVFDCWDNVDSLIYCMACVNNSKNCFGCIGLKNKEYCVFNKQYTKQEYETLVPKIIEHMRKTGDRGEFFPSSLSPLGYNETAANDYFPLTKEAAITAGYKRFEEDSLLPKINKMIQVDALPDRTEDIQDDIITYAIACEATQKPFRVIIQELEFYRKYNLPLPHKHPDIRHAERLKLRNPSRLRDRTCAKCGTTIKTSYSLERKEIVYCEECYNKEVYG